MQRFTGQLDELLRSTGPWLIVGLLLAAIVEPVLAHTPLLGWPDALQVLCFAVIGVPLSSSDNRLLHSIRVTNFEQWMATRHRTPAAWCTSAHSTSLWRRHRTRGGGSENALRAEPNHVPEYILGACKFL